jgi:hypothetical protein
MLTFKLCTADDFDRKVRAVHIDPAAVVAVEEAERCSPLGDCYPVAVITLATGDKYIVEDGTRKVARTIAQAKQLAEAWQHAIADDCTGVILQVLREAGRTLTTTGLLEEMARQGTVWSERTVCRHLAALTKDGILVNVVDSTPRGYRLAQRWQQNENDAGV